MSIEVRHLTHCYSEGSAMSTVALDDVSLTIGDGEFIGIYKRKGERFSLVKYFYEDRKESV